MQLTDNPAQITASVPEFCRLSGLGRATVYRLLADGRLASIAVGARRLIVLASWHSYVAEQLNNRKKLPMRGRSAENTGHWPEPPRPAGATRAAQR